MNEDTSLYSLQGDPKNPRTISSTQYEKLKELLKKFGDLSGIVKNVRTGQLVGGHMRVKSFQEDQTANIQITQRFNEPSQAGTIALGYVVVGGETFSYREVDWPVGMQKAANIAANEAGGDFDKDLLGEVMYEISQLENGNEMLELTAFSDKAITKILDDVGALGDKAEDEPKEDPDENELVFRLNPEQSELIMNAIEHVRITKDIPSSDSKTMNGSALYYMCEEYLATHEPIREQEFQPPELPTM